MCGWVPDVWVGQPIFKRTCDRAGMILSCDAFVAQIALSNVDSLTAGEACVPVSENKEPDFGGLKREAEQKPTPWRRPIFLLVSRLADATASQKKLLRPNSPGGRIRTRSFGPRLSPCIVLMIPTTQKRGAGVRDPIPGYLVPTKGNMESRGRNPPLPQFHFEGGHPDATNAQTWWNLPLVPSNSGFPF